MTNTGAFVVTSLVAAVVIATAVVQARSEIERLRLGGRDPFVSRRRTVRRVAAAAVLVVLMVMLFYGINYGESLVPRQRFLRFWNTCFALVPALVVLALLDAWETHQVVKRQMRAELSHALRKLEEELSAAERKLAGRAAPSAEGDGAALGSPTSDESDR